MSTKKESLDKSAMNSSKINGNRNDHNSIRNIEKEPKLIKGKNTIKKQNHKGKIKIKHSIPKKIEIHNKIESLISKDLQKNREKKEINQQKKSKDEEKFRLNKELLSVRNKIARKINSKSFCKGRGSRPENNIDTNKKTKKPEMSHPITPVSRFGGTNSDRRARLGLVFLDLQNKRFGTEKIQNNIKPTKEGNITVKSSDTDHVLRIREYMKQKKVKLQAELHKKEQAEKIRKAKINNNADKLQKLVSKIFSERQSSKASPAKAKYNVIQKGGKKQKKKKSDYIQYLLPEQKITRVNNSLQVDGNRTTPDPQFMNNIRVELLNEINSGRHPGHCKNTDAKMLFKEDNIVKIQRAFREYIKRKKEIFKVPKQENNNIEKEIKGKIDKKQNSKQEIKNNDKNLNLNNKKEDVDNEDRIMKKELNKKPNTKNEDVKELIIDNTAKIVSDLKQKEDLNDPPELIIKEKVIEKPKGEDIETQTEKIIVTEEIQIQTSIHEVNNTAQQKDNDDLNNVSSVGEMRLLLGSEKKRRENVPQEFAQHSERNSINSARNDIKKLSISDEEFVLDSARQDVPSLFLRSSFDDFTLKKLQELVKVDNVSQIIGMREKVLKYKESSEKLYIRKMYKAKKISPREYQRKRKEIEKWATKEREEIKKTKTSLIESWKKTEKMVEEAHHNTLQLKKLLAVHTLSYNSDTASNLSLLDSNRAVTDRSIIEEIKILHIGEEVCVFIIPAL